MYMLKSYFQLVLKCVYVCDCGGRDEAFQKSISILHVKYSCIVSVDPAIRYALRQQGDLSLVANTNILTAE